MNPQSDIPEKQPPLPQTFYEDNRQRFEGESRGFDIKSMEQNKCTHEFYRKTATEIGCKKCSSGWIDLGKIAL